MESSQTYSPTARHFHWWTFAFIAIQFPLGIAMVIRGDWLNIWDHLTDTMFDSHKLLGIVIFVVVAARLGYRLFHGGPADEPTLEPWQELVAHITHWSIYVLLLIVPVIGWLGIELYPALTLFGLFSLPAIISPDNAAAERALLTHAILAFLLAFLIASHIGAALFHYVIRKDGVLTRMIPIIPVPKRR